MVEGVTTNATSKPPIIATLDKAEYSLRVISVAVLFSDHERRPGVASGEAGTSREIFSTDDTSRLGRVGGIDYRSPCKDRSGWILASCKLHPVVPLFEEVVPVRSEEWDVGL